MIQPDVELVIFDADGTLRRCTVADQACPNRAGEWELIAGVKEGLAQIPWHAQGIAIGIASNQGGVGLGYLSEHTAFRLIVDLVQSAFDVIPDARLIQICPHSPNDGCVCRKPKPEMIYRIVNASGKSYNRTIYVGDLEADKLEAENAGVSFQWAWEFFGRSKEEWVGWLAMRAEQDRADDLERRMMQLGA
jgi:D-glycero-D-manno-heptose 1,7-bisphosphate phosphatase